MKEFVIGPIAMLIIFLMAWGIAIGCADYTLDYWGSQLKGEYWESPFWLDILVGIATPIPVTLAVATAVCDALDWPANNPRG